MLDLCRNEKNSVICDYALSNWEEDIQEVIVEPCDTNEDETGYRAVYYKDHSDISHDLVESYIIGASFLKNRLKKLRRAGFDAPMTKEALNIISQKSLRLAS